jgi:flavodoxin
MNIKVVYFTRTGNSKRVAEKITSKLSLDLIQINDHHNWKGFIGYIRAGFYSTVDKKVEITLNHPIEKYDELIVVSPLWAGGAAPAIRAFFKIFPKEKSHLIITSIGSMIKAREGYLSVTDIIQRENHEDEVIDHFITKFNKK